MTEDPVGAAGRTAGFHPTRWSLVLAAAGSDENARQALSTLCATYWYPLYAFARRRGADAHSAEDLVQGFFARLLERNDLAAADPGRGRFRAYLLTAFKNFTSNVRRAERTVKRGGGQVPLSLDLREADGRYAVEPADERPPEDVFERAWAQSVLRAATERLRADYDARGRAVIFEGLLQYLGGADVSYADTARALGMTEGAVRVAVHRLRQAFGVALRAEIAQTVADPGEVEGELVALQGILMR